MSWGPGGQGLDLCSGAWLAYTVGLKQVSQHHAGPGTGPSPAPGNRGHEGFEGFTSPTPAIPPEQGPSPEGPLGQTGRSQIWGFRGSHWPPGFLSSKSGFPCLSGPFISPRAESRLSNLPLPWTPTSLSETYTHTQCEPANAETQSHARPGSPITQHNRTAKPCIQQHILIYVPFAANSHPVVMPPLPCSAPHP